MSEQMSNNRGLPDASFGPRKPKKRRPWRVRMYYQLGSRRMAWHHSYATKEARDQALEVLRRRGPGWEAEAIDP